MTAGRLIGRDVTARRPAASDVSPSAGPGLPARWHRLGVDDVAGPTFVVLLLFIGLFKGAPFMQWAPLDLTIVSMALVVAAVAVRLLGERGRTRLQLWAVLSVALAAPAALFPTLSPLAPEKRLRLLIPLVAIVGVCYLVQSHRKQQVWVWLHVAVGVSLVATGVGLADDAVAGRFSGAGATTIGAGRASGVAILVLLVLLMTGGLTRWWSKASALALAVWLTLALIDTGSRGPVFSCAAAVLLVAALAPGRRRLLRGLAALGAVGAGWLLLTEVTGLGATRITSTISGQYSLAGPRLTMWHEAIRAIAVHPLGIGWGNFWAVLSPAERLDSGYNQYPHNALLEVTVEAGWLAGAAVLLFVVASLVRLYRGSGSPYGAALLGIAIFFLLNGLVSGDVNDNRTMWAALAIAWVASAPPERESKGPPGPLAAKPNPLSVALPPRHLVEDGGGSADVDQERPGRTADSTIAPRAV